MAYNTGNPIGSKDPRDLSDNAEILDEYVNSEKNTQTDRLGRLRLTKQGLENAAVSAGPTVEAAVKAWEEAADAKEAAEAAASEAAAQVTADVAAEVDRASAAADRAEAAAAASVSSAGIYPDTAAGLAGTTDGDYFSVPSAEDDRFIDLYMNDSGSALLVKSYPSAEAVQNLEGEIDDAAARANAAFALAGSRSFGDAMPWAVTDEHLRVILGVRKDGVAEAVLDKMPGLPILGPFAWAIADADGYVLLGVRWSGEVVAFGLDSAGLGPLAWAEGPNGGRDVFVLGTDGLPYQLTSDGDNFDPTAGDGIVRYTRRAGGISRVAQAVPAPGSVAPFVQRYIHILSSGQSLSIGVGSDVTTAQPPSANRLFTMAVGVRLAADRDIEPEDILPLQPLIATTTEAPAVQLAAQLNRLRVYPSDCAVVVSCHGWGSRTIAQLSKGGRYYDNSIDAVSEIYAHCNSNGYDYRVPFVDWIQGETDRNIPAGDYKAALLQLQSDYSADIKAITGQVVDVPILTDQISNWTNYGIASSYVPLEQLEAALEYPGRVVCAGPKYWAGTYDGIHLRAPESMRLGCMHARAAAAIINGGRWLPTHCIRAVRTGAVVELEFHTPFGPLVLDTVAVSDPGDWGLRYVDSGGVATIDSLEMLGNNRVRMTLSAVPAGSNAYVGIADIGEAGEPGGPFTGPRACLRDSSPDLDGYGQPVYNWACHQRIAVTTA